MNNATDKALEAVRKEVDDIKSIIKSNYPSADVKQIDKAFELAKAAHGDQKRRSGEPYIVHPVAVAYILAEYHMDMDTIIAALLHDVIEDTIYTYDDIAEKFNQHIAYMVDSVSKITRLNYQSKEESQAEYVRKMIIAMSTDIRIIIIKLVDRLHNMRTLEYMSSAKQREKSLETLDIYAPIANRLGIQSIKAELEDLAFKYLKPNKYYELLRKVKMRKGSKEAYINLVVNKVKKSLTDVGLDVEVYGRTKHLYSIFKKMQKTGSDFDEIYDLFAVRVITNSISDCYAALGAIHTNWQVLPNRLKDYITVPKGNGYQSLHTTVIGPNGSPLEIQIRTKEMHEQNEYGIAAHWKYKEGRNSLKEKDVRYDQAISWLRQLIDWTKEVDTARDFVETLKVDVLNEEVYVYTPEGEVVELPIGSCPIDFAYRIHTDLGNYCVGAKVNNKLVPLNYPLEMGDIVNIITSKNSHGPSRDWLNFVKSAHARNKIRQFFKKEEREENTRKGRLLIDAEVKKLGQEAEDLLTHEYLEKVATALGYRTVGDLYLALGVSSIKTGAVLQKMEFLFPEKFVQDEPEIVFYPEARDQRYGTDILVAGESGIETHLAKCCHPVPGDKIVGYTTQNNGIAVHRSDCNNIPKMKDQDRFIDVQWATVNPNDYYNTDVYIETISRTGGMVDILKPFYDLGTQIVSTHTKTENEMDLYSITCKVKNLRTLSLLLKEIKKIPDVIKAYRI